MKKLFVIAAVATLATAAQAQTSSKKKVAAAAKPASSATTVAAPAPSVAATTIQTSTTVAAPAADAPSKSWSVALMNQSTAMAADLNYSNNKQKSFESVNYVGFGYKLNAKSKLTVRHNFQQQYDGAAEKNTITNLDPTVVYAHTGVSGLLGSNELAPAYQYYIPVTDGSRKVNSYGKLRADLLPTWTITPKWSFAYALSPRQSLVPTSEVMDAEGKVTKVESKTQMIQNPYISYSINDNVDLYGGLTFIHVFKTASATLDMQETDYGVGVYCSFLGGKLILNPEIAIAQEQVKGGVKVAQENPFQEKNLSYTLTSVLAF